MVDLSPAAQAVLDAMRDECAPKSEQQKLATDFAAALEALAEVVVPAPDEADYEWNPAGANRQELIRHRIFRIAAELRGGQADD